MQRHAARRWPSCRRARRWLRGAAGRSQNWRAAARPPSMVSSVRVSQRRVEGQAPGLASSLRQSLRAGRSCAGGSAGPATQARCAEALVGQISRRRCGRRARNCRKRPRRRCRLGASIATTGTRLIWPRRRKNSGAGIGGHHHDGIDALGEQRAHIGDEAPRDIVGVADHQRIAALEAGSLDAADDLAEERIRVVVTIMPMVRVRLDFSERGRVRRGSSRARRWRR